MSFHLLIKAPLCDREAYAQACLIRYVISSIVTEVNLTFNYDIDFRCSVLVIDSLRYQCCSGNVCDLTFSAW